MGVSVGCADGSPKAYRWGPNPHTPASFYFVVREKWYNSSAVKKITVLKLGTEQRPATDEDLAGAVKYLEDFQTTHWDNLSRVMAYPEGYSIETLNVDTDESIFATVGTDANPASEDDLINLEKVVNQALDDQDDIILVCHHAVKFEVVKSESLIGKIMSLKDFVKNRDVS